MDKNMENKKNNSPPTPPDIKYSRYMVYYNILGVFSIWGAGGVLSGGEDETLNPKLIGECVGVWTPRARRA